MWSSPTGYLFLLLLVGGALLVVGVAVIWWALFADKARGRRRCPRCWHDLRHTPGLTCGECGYTAADEREFRRTRRRWRIALGALVLILGTTIWIRVQGATYGWSGLVPNGVLVTLVSWLHPPGPLDDGWYALQGRVRQHMLSPEAEVALARRLGGIREDDVLTHPAGQMLATLLSRDPNVLLPPDRRIGAVSSAPAAAETPAEQAARQQALLEHRAHLDEAIADIPLEWHVDLPAVIPEGTPPLLHVQGVLWGQRVEWRAAPTTAEAQPVDETGAPLGPPLPLAVPDEWLIWSSTFRSRIAGPVRGVIALGDLPDSPHPLQVTVELDVQTRRWDWRRDGWGPWVPAPSRRLQQIVRTQPAPLIQQVVTPVLDDAIARMFSRVVSAWPDDERPIGLTYNPRVLNSPEYDDLLLGVVVELLEDGQPRRRLRFWWQGGFDSTPVGVRPLWSVEMEDAPALLRLRERNEGWTIRVTGDVSTALRALPTDADGRELPAVWRVWMGVVERPVEVAHPIDTSPARIWRRQGREPRVAPR